MIDKETAKKHIKETCGEGWLILVDIVFDNTPEDIVITEVFQKYGRLEISYDGENGLFEDLVDTVFCISEKMCEICGQSCNYTIIDGIVTALCDLHYNNSDATTKYRTEK